MHEARGLTALTRATTVDLRFNLADVSHATWLRQTNALIQTDLHLPVPRKLRHVQAAPARCRFTTRENA
jgi:hypothetical protein